MTALRIKIIRAVLALCGLLPAGLSGMSLLGGTWLLTVTSRLQAEDRAAPKPNILFILTIERLRMQLDRWSDEHGDKYQQAP